MNYYSFHIGDYRRDTTHLSLLEHGAYRQLLDWHYLNEQPIPKDIETIFRRLSARTEEERKAVEVVLSEMFTLTDDGYVQARVVREVALYQAKAEHAREIGKRGGRPPKTPQVSEKTSQVPSRFPEETYEKPNQEPGTNNQEPKTKNPLEPLTPSSRGTRLPKDWALPSAWGAWAMKERPELTRQDVLGMADEFRDYWISVAGKDGLKRDWFATWRNKVRHTKRPRQSGQKKFDPFAYVNRNFRRPTDAFEH